MKRSEYKSIGKVTIGEKRGLLREHLHAPWFQFGGHNVRAATKDEAIAALKVIFGKKEEVIH